MNFTEEKLKERLAGKNIGGFVRYFREIDSTNIMACHLARDGAPEGTIVVADAQGKGKGRLNRVWQSPPHGGKPRGGGDPLPLNRRETRGVLGREAAAGAARRLHHFAGEPRVQKNVS